MDYGNELFIIHNEYTCNGNHESVGSIEDYLFSPIETPEQKAAREEIAMHQLTNIAMITFAIKDESKAMAQVKALIERAGYRKQ